MKKAMVVTHGGTDSKPEHSDGCHRAAQRALQKLEAGEDALEAAVAAVEVLEEDGRYGAGLGSPLGMDGKTIEMCAGVMDSRGRLGAVAVIEHTPHPVRVARWVAETPHCLLAGEGAIAFARQLGLYQPFEPNDKVRKEFEEYVHKLQAAGGPKGPADDTEGDPGRALVKQFWNYERPWSEVMDEHGHGTVGAVIYCDGQLAVATSTGGSAPALLGRVADIPQAGTGFYAAQAAAVACSGIGEHNVRHLTAFRVHQWIEAGMPLRQALQKGVDFTPPGLQSAMIGVTPDDAQLFARRPMAHAILRSP